MNIFQRIDAEARRAARRYRRSEGELILALQQVDAKKVYRRLGFNSLHDYVTRHLKLPSGTASGFIAVARKSVQIPELQREIFQGNLSVSMAKRVTRVITPENKTHWIEKAKSSTQRELEEAVAEIDPQMAVPERLKPVSGNRTELRVGLSREVEARLRRVQDLLSQKKR